MGRRKSLLEECSESQKERPQYLRLRVKLIQPYANYTGIRSQLHLFTKNGLQLNTYSIIVLKLLKENSVTQPIPSEELKQQSKDWDKYKDVHSFIHDCFPFKAGIPSMYGGKTYTIITRDGKHHTGSRIDDSRQYQAEGIEWRTKEASNTLMLSLLG